MLDARGPVGHLSSVVSMKALDWSLMGKRGRLGPQHLSARLLIRETDRSEDQHVTHGFEQRKVA